MASKWMNIVVAAIFMALFLLMNAFTSLLYDVKFYNQQYEENGAYDELGKETVLDATDNLYSFLKGDEGLSDFYTEKEKAHMDDVRNLVGNTNSLKWMFLGFGILLTFFLYFGEPEHAFSHLSHAFIAVGVVTILGFIISIFLSMSFSDTFVSFHEVFFDNDLWMLDPGVDHMLTLFPESFFAAFFSRIMIKFLAGGISLGMIGGFLLYFVKKGKLR